VLDSTALVARFGHESGFSPDGNTFYATGTALAAISGIDVSDPKHPHSIWQGNIVAHGITVGAEGNRAYVADPIGGDMLILDTSEIQARRPHPAAREISRLTWGPATIPQNAVPIMIRGRPYVVEFDEYSAVARIGSTSKSPAGPDTVGAARIIDISDETKPRVVSNLRLAVNQPAAHRAAAGDPGAMSPVQGYAAHYCSVPTQIDPTIVACSFISSGLRVFDIRNPAAPREIAYFVAPPKAAVENGGMPSDFAMSRPSIDPQRHEIWYTDGVSGFYVVRLDPRVWPSAAGLPELELSSVDKLRNIRAGHRTHVRLLIRIPRDEAWVPFKQDEVLSPVSGATISLNGRRVQTDANGGGTLAVRVPAAGGYRVTVTKPGYAPGVLTVRVRR
jgi:hypothetical protein